MLAVKSGLTDGFDSFRRIRIYNDILSSSELDLEMRYCFKLAYSIIMSR